MPRGTDGQKDAMAMPLCRRYSVPFLDRYGTVLTSWVAIAPIGLSDWGGPWEDTHNRVSAELSWAQPRRRGRGLSMHVACSTCMACSSCISILL